MFTHYHTRSTLVIVTLLALTLGIAIGLGIATWIAMSTLQMDFYYPAMTGWGWA